MDHAHLPRLPTRPVDGHKGTFGRALILGGSRGMAGAPALAAMAAARSGAGLTTIAVPDRCLETVAGWDPTLMTVPLPQDALGRLSLDAIEPAEALCRQANSIGLGPGLSQSDDLTRLVWKLYESIPAPMVVDADGLNALANASEAVAAAGPRILTPHIGEFRRLVQKRLSPATPLTTQQCREAAPKFAKTRGVIVILKGPASLITDGETTVTNTTGNPGMATGGSGDVLTGVITGLLAQGLSAWESAVLGTHVHGLAGDFARNQLGEVSMVASDIKDHLAPAFRSLTDADAK